MRRLTIPHRFRIRLHPNPNPRPDPRFVTCEPNTGCWLWLGYVDTSGYAYCHETQGGAHRIAYENAFGPIAKGWHVHHTCEQRICVNPHHLEALTPKEHARRHLAKITSSTRARLALQAERWNSFVRRRAQDLAKDLARARRIS